MTKTAESPWGNPALKTYQRSKTHLVSVDEMRLRVHKVLAPIVERVLTDLSQSDLVVAKAESYPASTYGTSIILELDPANPDLVAEVLARYGFEPTAEGSTEYEWALGYEAAVEVQELAERHPEVAEPDADETPADEQETATAEESVWPVDHPDWFDGLPGERHLMPGEGQMGRDVVFLQCYLDVPRTGVYDAATVHAVGYFQGRRGMPTDGTMREMGWRQFLPRVRYKVFPSDTGRYVRMLAAGMIAQGYQAADQPVSARYTRQLLRDARAMQKAHDGRPTGRITSVEWSWLIAYPW